MDEVIDEPLPDVSGFATLEAEARVLEGAALPPDQAASPALPADTAAELRGALDMLRLMVAPGFAWWPDFPTVWSDQALQGIADGGAAVMHKHGWTMGGLFNEFGPYIALAGATLPPALVTYQAMTKHKLEQARAARNERHEPAAH